jgi:hypothetical protein
VLAGERHDLVGTADRVWSAGDQRGAYPLRDVPRLHLVAERDDRRRRRPDPGQAGIGHRFREARVLGEEAVAGVDGVRRGLLCDLEELVDVQVTVRRGPPVQGVRLVGHRDVQRVEILRRVDGHAAQPRVPAGPGDADRDLTAIGDQNLSHVLLLRRPRPSLGNPSGGSRVRPRRGGECRRPVVACDRGRPTEQGPEEGPRKGSSWGIWPSGW